MLLILASEGLKCLTREEVHHYNYYLHAVSLHPLLQDMVNAYLHFCSHSRGSGRAGRKRQDIPPSPVAGTGPIRCREICLLIASVILDRLQTLDMRIGTSCLVMGQRSQKSERISSFSRMTTSSYQKFIPQFAPQNALHADLCLLRIDPVQASAFALLFNADNGRGKKCALFPDHGSSKCFVNMIGQQLVF